jgi:two-component system, chemotaxis family, chemotaxis protein CheY
MLRLLVIDDDPVIRRTIKRILADPNCAVFEAANGLVGLECYQALRHDLVITDLLMEVQEGVKTIMELRAFAPSLPILAISGGWQYPGADPLSLAQRLGATTTLSKPFTAAELRRAVAQCLRAAKSNHDALARPFFGRWPHHCRTSPIPSRIHEAA